MPCQCNKDISSMFDNLNTFQAIKENLIDIIEELHEYCCFGVASTSPIANYEEALEEAFSNSIGSVDCECPLAFIFNTNNEKFYYSVDNGLTWLLMKSPNDCILHLEIENQFVSPNFEDNESNQDILELVDSGCALILAVDQENKIWKWQVGLELGEGAVQGEWCRACSEGQESLELFTYTGSPQYTTKPVLANRVEIKAWGAGGGDDDGNVGGYGGYATAIFDTSDLFLADGDQINIYVGGGGNDGFSGSGANAGGYPFGGNSRGSNNDTDGGSGGGLSGATLGDINPSDVSNALVIAGGGGGANLDGYGGNGSSPTSGGSTGMQGHGYSGDNTAGAGGGGGWKGGIPLGATTRRASGGGDGYYNPIALSGEYVGTIDGSFTVPRRTTLDFRYAPSGTAASGENGFVLVRWFSE